MAADGEVRGSEPLLTTKEAILEIRGDVKSLLVFMEVTKAADLPTRMDNLEDEMHTQQTELATRVAWTRGAAAVGSLLGGGSILWQILSQMP